MPPREAPYDVVVVGLGLTGLVAGIEAARAGARTLVVGKGYGTTQFRAGGVDVLAYDGSRLVKAPGPELATFAASRPDHPYACVASRLKAGLDVVRKAMADAGVEMVGGLEANRAVATAAGTFRTSCLVQPGMAIGWERASVVAVGLRGYRDFQADFFATVLPAAAASQGIELTARAVTVDLPDLDRRHLGAKELSLLFDQAEFRARLASALEDLLEGASVAVFPAVLGLRDSAGCLKDLERRIGVRVVEAPTLPPSVPGLRLQSALERALRAAGGTTWLGSSVRAQATNGRVAALEVAAAGGPVRLPIDRLVLATGGLASGGIELSPDGGVMETVAGLELIRPSAPPEDWFERPFADIAGQPAAMLGVRFDSALRPLTVSGDVAYDNVRAAGGLLAGADRVAEKSADGIACASAVLAVEAT